MNPLPRFLALALFVVLAALVALLLPTVRHDTRIGGSMASENRASVTEPIEKSSAPAAKIAVLSQRLALGLAVLGAALALTLTIALAVRSPRPADSQSPFTAAQRDVGALAKLAESSIAQGAELNRERDVRRRAE
jgi:hypothetical protein